MRVKSVCLFFVVTIVVLVFVTGALYIFASYTIPIKSESVTAASTYSYTAKEPVVPAGGYQQVPSTYFTVSDLSASGVCCESAATHAKSGKAKITTVTNTSKLAKAAYYYGYKKGWEKTANENRVKLARILSRIKNPSMTTWPFSKSSIDNLIDKLSDVTVPSNFVMYYADPTDSAQAFCVWKYMPNGNAVLTKTSTTAATLSAGSPYNFSGIVYTVYNSQGVKAGTLTLNSSGKSNKLSLSPGTYTVKETSANSWYALNQKTYSLKITSGKTTTITASDNAVLSHITIKKQIISDEEYDGDLSFEFRISNTLNANAYTLKTNAETGEASIDIPAGTYKITETIPENTQIVDETGLQVKTFEAGKSYEILRTNKLPPGNSLLVTKATDDGSSVQDFSFKVTGHLYNEGTMTSQKLLEAASPDVSGFDKNVYTLGDWSVAEDSLSVLNEAASDGENNETKEVTITNQLLPASDNKEVNGGEEALKPIDLTARVPVTLKGVEFVYNKAHPDSSYYESELSNQIRNFDTVTEVIIIPKNLDSAIPTGNSNESDEDGDDGSNGDGAGESDEKGDDESKSDSNDEVIKISINKFEWYGAATEFREISNGTFTGKNYSILTTNDTGKSATLTAKDGIAAGEFTAEELLTDEQQKHYKTPSKQIIKIAKSEKAAFVFNFENIAKRTAVKLVKTCKDGNISGISFHLEGTNVLGDKIDISAVTNSQGLIEFGKLYAGEYIISETDFDPALYRNDKFKLDGYDVPAQNLTITGTETAPVQVEFENIPQTELLITKIDKISGSFLEGAVFSIAKKHSSSKGFASTSAGSAVTSETLATFTMSRNNNTGNVEIEFLTKREDANLYPGLPNQTAGDSEEASEDAAQSDETDQSDESERSDEFDLSVYSEASDKQLHFAIIKGLDPDNHYVIKELVPPVGYSVKASKEFDFEDGMELIIENANPEISTTALDKDSETHMVNADGTVTIIDTVSYENVEVGHEYELKGTLCYREDDEDASNSCDDETGAGFITPVKDSSGKEITATKKFTPSNNIGTTTVEFTFDASLLDGKKTVVFEDLLDPSKSGEERLLVSDANPKNNSQSIYFPKLQTTAAAADTGSNYTDADSDVSITDSVHYSNVTESEAYRLTGTLMNKLTGKPVSINGQKVTATKEFTASSGEGDEELTFTFDGSAFGNVPMVVFEELSLKGSIIGSHKDLNDKSQTVYLNALPLEGAVDTGSELPQFPIFMAFVSLAILSLTLRPRS